MRLFLSYNSRDDNLARGILAGLRRRLGSELQAFYAPESLRGGSYWQESLAREIEAADIFVFLIAEHGVGAWQVPEYHEAHNRWVKDSSFKLVPVLKKGESAPGLPFLNQLHWIVEADPASERSVGRILDAIHAPRHGGQAEPWRHTRPYRGLHAMTEVDSDFFFGRRRETELILHSLERAPGKLPIILGNSGVGKSSIAQAGVLAAVKREAWPGTSETPWPTVFHESRRWASLVLRPGRNPLQMLVEAFWPLWRFDPLDPEREALQRKWSERLRDGTATLKGLLDGTKERLAAVGEPPPETFLLYVDQGEELYTRADPDLAQIFSEVLGAGLKDSRLLAFMSMRSDFYGRLQEDGPLYESWERIDVHPFDNEALLDIIRKPAEALGVTFFDPDLPQELARQTLENPGYLPLLSYLLNTLWVEMQERGDSRLMANLGRVVVGSVLAESGDLFLHQEPEQAATLRRIVTLKLVHLGETGIALRRRAFRSEFTDDEWRLVTVLAGHPWRLLVTGQAAGQGEPYVEVGHEAVLREWTQLRDWLFGESGRKEFLVWKTSLERMRRRYERLSEDEQPVALLQGYDLQQGRVFGKSHGEDLTAADQAYIEASARADDEAQEAKRRLLAQARAAQSSFLGDLSRQMLQEGKIGKALAFAVEAVPVRVPDWPRVEVAENALFAAVHAQANAQITPQVSFRGHEGTVRGCVLAAAGDRLLTWSYDGTARFWDTNTGKQLALLQHEGQVLGAKLLESDSGEEGEGSAGEILALTLTRTGLARIWSLPSGEPRANLLHKDLVRGGLFLKKVGRILTWSADGTARLWDLESFTEKAILRHQGSVYGASASSDESRLLTWSYDGTARFWDSATGEALALLRHGEGGRFLVRGAALSSDERRAITWSADGTARLWELAGSKQLALFRHEPEEESGETIGVLGASFSSDEQRLLAWASDGSVRLWNVSEEEAALVVRHESSVLGARLSKEEDRILSWSSDGTARLWSASSGEMLKSSTHSDVVLGASLSSNEDTLLSWSLDGTARLASTPGTTRDRNEIVLRHEGPVRSAFLSDNGVYLWSFSDDGTVRLWQTQDGAIVALLRHDAEILQVAFSSEKSSVVTCSADGTARLWEHSRKDRFTSLQHEDLILGGHLIAEGERALTWSKDGTARLWTLGQECKELSFRHSAPVHGARPLTTDQLLTWSADGTAKIWDTAGGGEVMSLAHGSPVSGALLAVGQDFLLTWSVDGTVKAWRYPSGEEATGCEHPGRLEGLVLSGAAHFLTWSPEGEVLRWRIGGAEKPRSLPHGSSITGVVCSRDGSQVLTWGRDGRVCLWDVVADVAPRHWHHRGSVTSACFSRDEARVLTSSADGTAAVWSVKEEKPILVLRHKGSVSDAHFSADESEVLTSCRDDTVRLWDLETNRLRVSFRHEAPVKRAAYSPDERWILTFSGGTVRLWDSKRGDKLGEFRHGGDLGGADLSCDTRRIFTWSKSGNSAFVWPIWDSPSVLTERATTVLEKIHPLSKVDRCRAHLDTDGCFELGNALERDLALQADEGLFLQSPGGVGNLTDFAKDLPKEKRLDINVGYNAQGRVAILHSAPLKGLKRVEAERLTRALYFVSEDDRTRNAGLPLYRSVSEALSRTDIVLLAHVDPETKEILGHCYLPLECR